MRPKRSLQANCSSEFDLSSVEFPRKNTHSLHSPVSRSHNHPEPRTNLFGLNEAKTYFPSKLEFSDPLSYIEKIRHEAEIHGIIKIVPPTEWRPTFSIDTKNFRFHTRLQQLNALEGNNRLQKNYVDQVLTFHEKAGQKILKIPHLDKKPIDILKLRDEVYQRGGYEQVTKKKMWAEIGRFLGYDRKSCTSLSNTLKTTFFKIIKPYEDYHTKSDIPQVAQPEPHKLPKIEQSLKSPKANISLQNTLQTTVSELNTSISQKNDPSSKKTESGYESSEYDSDDDRFWLDYGFEEGSTYSLSEFQQKSNSFKMQMFPSYFKDSETFKNNSVPSEVVEKTFWNLVANPDRDISVEYGADLASSIYGSGFPTPERQPLDPYSTDSWNLTNIPYSTKSLFNYLKEEVDGMTIPWLYVGMCLSAFCWHNEDHYTYSINYMHWGEPKTWYGVPGSQSELFESSMKTALPELFNSNPNLLFHLVTIVSPKVLKDSGVDVVTIDQHPGEFIVTFPQAYHSGFNQGFNFNEAVNFATADWVPFGNKSVKNYQAHKRFPVFCHEELLYVINQHYLDTNSPRPGWLADSISNAVSSELKSRNQLRSLINSSSSSCLCSELNPEHKTSNFNEISIDQIVSNDSDNFSELESLVLNSTVNCKECLKLCFFSFVCEKDEHSSLNSNSNTDLNFLTFCPECFSTRSDKKPANQVKADIWFVLRLKDAQLSELADNGSELPLKWIASVWELSLNQGQHELHSSNQKHSKGSRNLNSHNLKAILNEDCKSEPEESGSGKLQLAVSRSIINYSSYLVGNSTIPPQAFITENFNQLLEFNKKANYLCAVTQAVLKCSNKLDALKKLHRTTLELASAVLDPIMLFTQTETPLPLPLPLLLPLPLPLPLSLTTDHFVKSTKHFSEKIIKIFKSLNALVDIKAIPSPVNFKGSLVAEEKPSRNPPTPPNRNTIQQDKDHSLSQQHQTNNYGDTISLRSTRSRRITSSYNGPGSPYATTLVPSTASRKSVPLAGSPSISVKPENSYNYLLHKAKPELSKLVENFCIKVGILAAGSRMKPPYSVNLIDALLKEFRKLNFDCPEFSTLKNWHSDYLSTIKKLENFLNLMSHYKLSENECTYCLQDNKKCKYSLAVNIILDDSLTAQLDSLAALARDMFLECKDLEILENTRPKLIWALTVKKELKNRSLDMGKMIQLLENAIKLGISAHHPDFTTLKNVKSSIVKWDQEVSSVLGLHRSNIDSKSVLTLRKCATLLERAHNLEFPPQLFNELKKVQSTMLNLQALCDSIVEKATSNYFPSRPSLDEAQKVYLAIEDNEKKSGYVFIPNSTSQLKQYIMDGEKWLFEVKHAFTRSNVTRTVYDVLVDVAQGTKKGNEIVVQICDILSKFANNSAHDFLENLYFDLSKALYGQYLDSGSFSILKSFKRSTILCVCESLGSGLTVKCSTCPLLFHTKCLKHTKKQVHPGNLNMCPICNKDVSLSRFTKYPTISSVGRLIDKGRRLNLVCPELDLLLNVALDIRSIANSLYKIIETLEHIQAAAPNNELFQSLQGLVYLVCQASILIKLGTEINIDKDNIGSLQCNGEYLESTLRKILSNRPLIHNQVIPFLERLHKPRPGKTRTTNAISRSIESIPKKQKLSRKRSITNITHGQIGDNSEPDADIPLNQTLVPQLNLQHTHHSLPLPPPPPPPPRQLQLPLPQISPIKHHNNNNMNMNNNVAINRDMSMNSHNLERAGRFVEPHTTNHMLKVVSNLPIGNAEICICQETRSTSTDWHSPTNYVICCDYCKEYFHLKCVLVSKKQAKIILHYQNMRIAANNFQEPIHELASSMKLMAYMCPICSYSRHVDYQYGEIELDAA